MWRVFYIWSGQAHSHPYGWEEVFPEDIFRETLVFTILQNDGDLLRTDPLIPPAKRRGYSQIWLLSSTGMK